MKLTTFVLFFFITAWSIAQTTFTAISSGNANSGATWDQSGSTPSSTDNVVIPDGFTVTSTTDATINDLTIDAGGILVIQDNDPLTINGDLILNGTIQSQEAGGNVQNSVRMSGGGTLDGTGLFTTTAGMSDNDNPLFLFASNTTILSTADLRFECLDFDSNLTVGIGSGITVTNQGSISIFQDLFGADATAAWVNDANSSLTVEGIILSTGALTASATGNTVSIQGSTAETIKEPEGIGNPYYNLIVGGSNTKTLPSDIEVTNLTISSILTTNDFNISVEGDWVNNGTFNSGLGQVTFSDGTDTDHSISGSVDVDFYDLVMATNNSVSLETGITVSNALTLNNESVVSTGNQVITLGTGTGSIGSFTQAGTGRVQGTLRRWVNAITTDFVFPVGGASAYNPVTLNFDNLSSGTVDVAFVESFPGTISSSIDDNGFSLNNTFSEGYWTIDNGNGLSTTSYNLFITANGFSTFTIDSDTRIVSRESNGTTWSTNGAHSTIGFASPTVQRSVVSLVPGEFALAVDNDCTPTSTTAIMGATDVCNSDSETYSVTGEMTSVFNWEVVGGDITAITHGTGSISGTGTEGDPSTVANDANNTTSEITVTWDIPGVGYVKVTEDNSLLPGCGLGEPQEVAVQVNPVVTSAITGSVAPVSGTSGIAYSVTETSGYSYAWTVTPSTNVTVNNDGNAAITIDWNDGGGNDAAAGDYTIQVIATSPSCGASAAVTLDVALGAAFRSAISGAWDEGLTWGNTASNVAGVDYPTIGDNAIIDDTDNVTIDSDEQVNNLTIEASATLTINDNERLDIYGDFTLDGSVVDLEAGGNVQTSMRMLGNGATLDGAGSYSHTGGVSDNDNALFRFEANTTIASTVNIGFSAVDTDNNQMIRVDANVVVTNLGNIQIDEDLIGESAASKWINGENASLSVEGNLFVGNGILDASASGNTVEYNGAGAQTIKDSESSTYHNLVLSGSGSKSLTAETSIAGDLTISSILEPSGNNLIVEGNWTNNGTFNQGTTAVTFQGTTSQTLSSAGQAVFYDLNVTKAGGTLTVSDNDIQIQNSLDLNNSNIDLGSDNVMTLGTSTSSVGTLNRTTPAVIIGQFERYIDVTSVDFEFPIGTSSFDRSLSLNFNSLTPGSVISSFVSSAPGALNNPPLVDNGFDVNNTFSEGYWVLTTANSLVSNDFNMVAEANGFSSFTLDENTRIVSRTSSGSDWELSGSHVDNAASFSSPSVRRNNVTVLSGEYTLASGDDCVRPSTSIIRGDEDVCTTSASYNVIGTTNSTFSWEVIGGTIAGGSGAGTEESPSVRSGVDLTSIDITWATGGTGIVRVTEDNTGSTEANPCGEGDQVELQVQVNPVPTSSITGSTSVISGSTDINYSVDATSGYTYDWSVTPSTNVVINNDGNSSVTIDWTDGGGNDAVEGTYTVSVTSDAPNACGMASAVTLDVSVQGAFQSAADGIWDEGPTWGNPVQGVYVSGVDYPGITDNAIISNIVSIDSDENVNGLVIESDGELILNDNERLDIYGDLTINGSVTDLEAGGNVQTSMRMLGSGATLDGTGSYSHTGSVSDNDNPYFRFDANTTIASTADISFTTNDTDNNLMVRVGSDVVVTNLGRITIDEDLIGNNANSSWVNSTNAYLSVEGNLFATNGNLTATAAGNTVEYNGFSNQSIKIPTSNTYENLILSGSRTKTLQSPTTITGTVTISSTLDPGGNDLTIEGSYDNQGSFDDAGINVIFSGSSDQTFTSAADEVLESLIINKTGGTVTSSNNVQVTNTLTLTGGDVNMQSNTLLLGSSTTATEEGTLVHSSPATVIGQFSRYINSNQSSFIFPVGTADNLNTATIEFNDAPTGILTLQFVEDNPGTDGLSFDDNGTTIFNSFFEGYWSLATSGGLSSTDYNVDLVLAGFSSFNTSTARVMTRANSSSDWIADGTHIAVSDDVAQRDNITTLGAELALGDITNCDTPGTSVITASSSVVCADDTGVTYTALGGLSGSTYTWEVVGGVIDDVNAVGAGTSEDPSTVSGLGSGGYTAVNVDWGSTGLVGSVQVIEDNNFSPIFGCGAGEPVILSVNVNPISTSAISGSTSVSRSQSSQYSVEATTDYTYNWTLSGGGNFSSTGTNTVPGGSNSVTVDWETIAGTYTLSVVGDAPGSCSNAASVQLEIIVSDAFESAADGAWDEGPTWGNPVNGTYVAGTDYPSLTDNAVITTHNVTIDSDEQVNNLIIESTGALTINDNERLDINGDFTLNGSVEDLEAGGNVQVSMRMLGSGATLDGTGSYTHTGGVSDNDNPYFLFGANTTIASTADISFTTSDADNNLMVRVGTNVIVTNFGQIAITEDLVGNDGGTWINRTGATLSVTEEILSNTLAILDASAIGNTVVYNGNGVQPIKSPQTTYSQLTIAGSGNKEMQSAITVTDDLTISGTLATNNFDLTIQGNWTNTGSYSDGTSTTIFSGASDQTISNIVGETFNSMTLDKSGGTLTLGNSVSVNNTLTMLQGTIDATSNPITLGVDASTEGTLAFTNGAVLGSFQRFVDADETLTIFEFPVGISGTTRSATLTFADITTGGLISGEFVSTAPGVNGLPLVDGVYTVNNTYSEGYWAFSSDAPNDIAFTTYDAELNGQSFTSFTTDADTRLVSRANSSSSWIANGTHSSGDGVSIARRTGLSSIDLEFAFGSDDTCDPPSTSVITADDDTPCIGDVTTYSVTNTVGSTYDWTVSGGTIISGDGTNSISVLWGSTGGTYTVEVVEDNSGVSGITGCGEGSPISLSVDLNPQVLGSISGRTSVAEGSSGVTYTVDALSTDYYYDWTVTNGTVTSTEDGVNNTSITVSWPSNGTGSVSVVAEYDCDGDGYDSDTSDPDSGDNELTNTQSVNVTIFPVIVSNNGVVNGNWNDDANWVGGVAPQASNSVRITGSSSFTFTGSVTVAGLEIEAGSSLTVPDQQRLTITGDLTLDGTIFAAEAGGNVALSVDITGDGAVLDGSGSISTTGGVSDNDNPTTRISSNATIATTANLNFLNNDADNARALQIAADRIVTNNGSITVSPNLEGGTNATLINTSTGTVSVAGELLTEATSVLNTSQAGNTINYSGAGAQTLKVPASNQYGNLSLSTSGNKTVPVSNPLEITGNLMVDGTANFVFNTNDITLGGNLTNNGTITTGGNSLTLNGSSDQTFTTAESFPNLVINKTESLVLGAALDITSALTMTQGDVDATANTLTLSGATLNYTSGTILGPFQRTISGSPASYNFPVGNDDGGTTIARPMNVEINALSSGGSLTIEFDPTSAGVSSFSSFTDVVSIETLFSEGVWRFTNSGITTTDYDLIATATDFTSFEFDASGDNRLIYDNGATWVVDGNHVTSSGSNVERAALDGDTNLSGVFGVGGITNCEGYDMLTFSVGATEVCTSVVDETYTVTGGAMSSTYNWSVLGGTIDGGMGSGASRDPSILTGAGASITIDWGATGTDEASVTVTEVNAGCTGTGDPQILDVVINPILLTTADVTGATAVLEGSLESYSVVNRTNYSYSWDAFGEGTFIGSVTTGPNVTINWGTSIGTTATLRVTSTYTGSGSCNGSAQDLDVAIAVGNDFTTAASGDWDDPAVWGGNVPPNNANVTITEDVTLNVSGVVVGDMIINDGFTFDNGTQAITVNGDYTLNGTHIANVAGGSVFLNGSGTIFGTNDGTPNTISENVTLTISDDYTIDSNADIEISGPLFINSGVTVTNNGDITIDANGEIQGASSSTSVWTNAANSSLTVTGNFTSGRLNASASPNTVTFDGTGAQTIPITSGSPGIQTLNLSGGTTKTIGGNVTINDLDIAASTTLATGSNDLTISGSITNAGTLDGTGGTIAIQGTTKTLTGTNTFNNLNVELDASNTLTVDPSGTITGDLAILTGGLTFSSSASETVNGLRISNGATLDASALTDLVINGNFTVESGSTFNNPTDAVNFLGTSQQIIGSAAIDNLEKDNGGTLTLASGNTTVATQLRLTDGNIVTSSTSLLILNDNAGVAGGSATSFVDGPLRKIGDDDFTFPVGDNGIYGPFNLSSFDGSTVTDAFTGTYFNAGSPNNTSLDAGILGVSGVEYWDIERSNGSARPIIELSWNDALRESGVENISTLLLAHFDGTIWEIVPATAMGDAVSGTITSDVVFNDFSEFCKATSDDTNPLPVELIRFSGVPSDNKVILNWSTSSEENNEGFYVERSRDGLSFESIGFISGKGNSNEVHHYDFVDQRPNLGYNFYRLKQVDYDGQFEYSNIISVFNDFIRSGITATIYPNPARAEDAKVGVLTGDDHTPILISIFDIEGRLIDKLAYSKPGLSENIVKLPMLVEGHYTVIVSQGAFTKHERLIIR